jgi:flavin reductase (DIM6/NTAB) family NADH-FMN oxidoreductase RutF
MVGAAVGAFAGTAMLVTVTSGDGRRFGMPVVVRARLSNTRYLFESSA